MSIQKFISSYWGKAQPSTGAATPLHPLAYHMLDVAAVARALIAARPFTLRKAEQLLCLPMPAIVGLLPLIAALHDLGKFARAFQNKVPEQFFELQQSREMPQFDQRRRHDDDGWLIWSNGGIAEGVRAAIWPDDLDGVLDTWLIASFAHHGRPISRQTSDLVARAFGPAAGDAREYANDIVRLLLPTAVETPPPGESVALRASNWIAGFVTLCDWLGSSQRWFPYRRPEIPMSDYWSEATEKAERALLWAGLRTPAFAAPKSLAQLTGIAAPTPLQDWAASVSLGEGPSLYIVEDVTGAGKTEAAQMLVHRLMCKGRASGAYWAMPTQATANAMYSRQAGYIDALFAGRPSIALAHGQAALSEPFQNSILYEQTTESAYGPAIRDDSERPASAACADFLAHDKRLSFLTDVGAGTIDQALLGALPSKFNTMRLMGLSEKVLVIDEAHAYDAYVQAETEGLLAFQASLGGSAIILSATLPMKKRVQYANAWRAGLANPGPEGRGLEINSQAYPLATVINAAAIREFPIEPAERSRRDLLVRFVPNEERAIQAILSAAAAGGAAAWIRNTVDDALRSATALREAGAEPLVFHARFAQCDRQAREQEVMRLFGRDSRGTSRNRILVATQVVEQSLDLDFDFMITDLAPIDLILQRTGRFRRHDRERPPGIAGELLVLAPEITPESDPREIKSLLPGTAAVYENPNILWHTARVLARDRRISAPQDFRRLVEEVYGPEAEPPRSLERAALVAEGNEGAKRAYGKQNMVNPSDGYTRTTVEWEDERKLRTRLADKSQTIRLASIGCDGQLLPYAKHAEEWKAWALSEIRMRTNKIPEAAQAPARFALRVDAVRANWRRFEKDLPLLVLEPSEDGYSLAFTRSDGAEATAHYNVESGLSF